MMFKPKYTVTSKVFDALARIDGCRRTIDETPINARVIASLRETARLNSTHFSTAIEGNRLSSEEVRGVIKDGGKFPNRERDQEEVLNYYRALGYVETLAKDQDLLITVAQIKTLHGLAFNGRKKPTPFRDAQNVIREGYRGIIVYIPPKAEDVKILMNQLLDWINNQVGKLPIPIVAGLAHYQFATIHPYFDGNGRTARLLTTLILHKYGYSLKGIFSLEEYYAANLPTYYDSLTVGTDEDYYDGNRADGDLTKFLEYFVFGMAEAFEKIQKQAIKEEVGDLNQELLLRELSPQQRQVLHLFFKNQTIKTSDIAEFFGVTERHALRLCTEWCRLGFFTPLGTSSKSRHYCLADKYEALIIQQVTSAH